MASKLPWRYYQITPKNFRIESEFGLNDVACLIKDEEDAALIESFSKVASRKIKMLVDPIDLVIEAFISIYPNAEALIQFNPEIDECGCTTFPDDGSTPVIDISSKIPYGDTIEILAHELAHVVAGMAHDHDEIWDSIFSDIQEKYEELFQQRIAH